MKSGQSAPFPDPGGVLADQYREAMSLLAGAVAVITAGRGERRRGLTATAVCSVSVQPPTMLICVNRYGEAHKAIGEAGSFCVNLLSADDEAVADSFAGRTGKSGAERFAEAQWVDLGTGSPALASAMVSLDCEVVEAVEAHTHTVFFGAVREVRHGTGTAPLVLYGRSYRKLS
jgi:flavin reductase (DIM6/NTAB) family NADH-FMN oxidoreductase RutF